MNSDKNITYNIPNPKSTSLQVTYFKGLKIILFLFLDYLDKYNPFSGVPIA